jgi:hypothetical protein
MNRGKKWGHKRGTDLFIDDIGVRMPPLRPYRDIVNK